MSFQAITNFLLNQNNVDLKNNFLDLQTTDFNNSKISNYSLSKTETFSDVLASYSSKTSKEENYSSDISKNEAKVQYDEKAGKDINEASKQSEIEKKDSVAEEKSNSSVEDVENKQTKSKDEVKNASETEKDSKKDKKVEKKVVLIKDESAVEANFELNQNVQVKSDEQKNQKLSAKDFSRINELGNVENKVQEVAKDEIPVDELNLLVKKDAKSKDNVQNQNEDAKIAFFNKNDGEIELELTKNDSSSQSKLDFSSQNEQQQKSEGKITVKDLRTEISEELKLSEKSDIKVTDVKVEQNQSATVTMELVQNNQTAQNNILSLNSQTASSNGSNFQAMLNNQIQANIPEFVKTGSIILKDNNQGNINLILNPEELGNVKISLALDGKSISGQITVVSKEALEVFKDNAETLREAFIKSGFENASINISFADNGSFGNETQNFEEFTKEHQRMFANKSYGGAIESESFDETENFENFANNSVNIVA